MYSHKSTEISDLWKRILRRGHALPMPSIRRHVISICLISYDADINDLVKLASTRLFSVKLTIFPFHFLFFTSKSSSQALSQMEGN